MFKWTIVLGKLVQPSEQTKKKNLFPPPLSHCATGTPNRWSAYRLQKVSFKSLCVIFILTTYIMKTDLCVPLVSSLMCN